MNKQKNNYHNYKISVPEALLFFIITVISGQFIGGIFSLPGMAYPGLADFFLPFSFFAGFGTAAFIIMLLKRLNFNDIKKFFHTHTKPKTILLGIILYLVALPIAEYLAMLVPTTGNTILEELYDFFEKSFAIIFEHKIAAFIMVCILAPILEELIFRGLILRGMLQHGINPWFAIIFTSLLFGIAHMNPWQFFGAGLLGSVFGYIYWRTQSLWLVIFLHALNNTIAYVMTIYTQNLQETIFEPNFFVIAASALLVLLIGWLLYQKTHNTTLHEAQTQENNKIYEFQSDDEIN
ncbi:MAG: type II CAAX endopeptidase family protein [Flavobacteriaceae bacterium]|nr:type II CAAX endopeptidase family protein [Flavobacteriaceae bacterium]